ncbi:MAG: glycosyltransferase [Acidimicrobiales bacterium]
MSAYDGSAARPFSTDGIERLFLTVGTDYHRFDRVIEWLDEWLETDPPVGPVIVQRGTSSASRNTESVDYLQRTQLIEEFRQASVVVCHGGPATILECRSNGLVPIVVPREAIFDEHVNDHQVDFCERLAAHGEIQLARTKDEFFQFLAIAVERGAPEVAVDDGHSALSLTRFENEMVQLLGGRARVLPGELASVTPLHAHGGPVPVVYIGAVPRSGSTVIADLLNEHPHVVNVGELVHLWERGLIEDNLCGCGARFSECGFWNRVGKIAFGGWEQISGERMLQLQRRVDRTRFIPKLLWPGAHRRAGTSIAQYGAVVSRILRAAREVSGAPVIVDTSKHVSTALLLRQLPDVDLRVVHLVRDPRGVAHSWAKKIARPEVHDDRDMDRLHPGRIGLRWLWFTIAFGNLDRLGVATARLRYEDFVADPAACLDSMFSFADVDDRGSVIVGDGTITPVEDGHSVAGNPRRLDSGPIRVRPDNGWKGGDPAMRRLVGRITRPLRRHYDYKDEIR